MKLKNTWPKIIKNEKARSGSQEKKQVQRKPQKQVSAIKITSA